MYIVKIINNDKEKVINHVSSNNNSQRIVGTVKQGINCINSFTFTIYPNNVGYDSIFPYKTQVTVYNTKTKKYEFIGRVLTLSANMDDNGLISKTFICESDMGFLCDSVQMYEELHNITIEGYLEKILEKHNKTVEEKKHFKLGNVTVQDSNDSLYRYVSYDTTWKNINSDLIDKLGGELQIRYENDIRYLDYLVEIGKTSTTEIRLGKNIKDITRENKIDNYCTRLIPLGAKIKTTDEEGNEVETQERITIAEVNNGLNYIDDNEAIQEVGIIQRIVEWDGVTEPKNLLTKAEKYLKTQKMSISNKLNAVDLSLIGLDVDSFEVGNWHTLKHELLNIDDKVRVVEKSICIENPYETEITLGDKNEDMKEHFKKTNTSLSKVSNEITVLNNDVSFLQSGQDKNRQEIKNVGDSVVQVGNAVLIIGDRIISLQDALSSVNGTVGGVQETVGEITNSLGGMMQEITEEGDSGDQFAPGEETQEKQEFSFADEFCEILENWYNNRDGNLTYGQTNFLTASGSKSWEEVTKNGYQTIDCSGLVGAALRGISYEDVYADEETYNNKSLGANDEYEWTQEPPRTAAEQCQWAREQGYEVPASLLHTPGTTDYAGLQKGDLIFRGGKNNGRYLGVYHVEVYLGDNQIIEATSSKSVSKHEDGTSKGIQKIEFTQKSYADIVCVARIQK